MKRIWRIRRLRWVLSLSFALLAAGVPLARAQTNMRREGATSLIETNSDETWLNAASNQITRVTVEADYDRDTNGQFHFHFFVTGIATVTPQTLYTAADTNRNYLGELVAQGDFAPDDIVVTGPALTIPNFKRSTDGSTTLQCTGIPALPHRIPTTANLATPGSRQVYRPMCPAPMDWSNLRTRMPRLF